MENAGLNQLPEVDTLPDGFVDSSPEYLSPPTISCELEKLPSDSKEDNLSELHHSDEQTHEVAADKPHLNKGVAEKTEKPKTFPVPLSEKDGSDDSVEQLEGVGAAIMPDSVGPLSEASVVLSGCSEVKESVTKKCQISETPIQRGSDSQLTHIKDISSSESVHSPNNSNQETSETKRKNSKQTFKSEKEFLECTLRYQQVLGERDTAISVRDKLESLCRELQRQNKMLMDECKRVSTEGQNLRLDLSARFQDAIKDVSNKLDEQKDESLAQLRENEMLRTKLKQFIDQYTLSEQQHEQQLKKKSLELQIADLKMKQHEEKLVQEQSQMKLYEEQVSQLLATEKNLRSQLTADGEKFQQFQDALLKSNEVFVTFKQEIKKMTKSVKELKNENMFLKSKSKKSDITLKELVEERERMKRQLEKTKNQKEKLESLCRSLQAERKLVTNGDNSSDSTLI